MTLRTALVPLLLAACAGRRSGSPADDDSTGDDATIDAGPDDTNTDAGDLVDAGDTPDPDAGSGAFGWEDFDCADAKGSASCGDVQECALYCSWEPVCVQGCLDDAAPASCELAIPMQQWMVCFFEECTGHCADPYSAECAACQAECPAVSEAEMRACWNDGCPEGGCN
jgi:hypothetical protein